MERRAYDGRTKGFEGGKGGEHGIDLASFWRRMLVSKYGRTPELLSYYVGLCLRIAICTYSGTLKLM